MKKSIPFLMMLALILILGVSQLSAQTILCVDRDFGDTSAGNVYTDTWPPISRTLDAWGFTYDYWEVLDPANNGPDATVMGDYDIVIWFTGEAWDAGETMGPDDEFNLLLYMSVGGGKLFMNAQDYLYDKYGFGYGPFTEGEFPYDQLGLISVEQDVYWLEAEETGAIADSGTFYGLPGSLAEGMVFPTRDIFTTDTDDGLYGDSIADHLGQGMIGLMEPYNSPGPAAIQYETEYFRSVFSTMEIAAITDTVARDMFMYKIIDWLMNGTTGISNLEPSDVQLVIKPNPVNDFVNIGMTETMEEIYLYNSQGQQLIHETVGGSSIRLDIAHLAPGIYITKIKTAQGIVTDKLIKL